MFAGMCVYVYVCGRVCLCVWLCVDSAYVSSQMCVVYVCVVYVCSRVVLVCTQRVYVCVHTACI